jgi:hypothetical protein
MVDARSGAVGPIRRGRRAQARSRRPAAGRGGTGRGLGGCVNYYGTVGEVSERALERAFAGLAEWCERWGRRPDLLP